jgi:hypothetical protein
VSVEFSRVWPLEDDPDEDAHPVDLGNRRAYLSVSDDGAAQYHVKIVQRRYTPVPATIVGSPPDREEIVEVALERTDTPESQRDTAINLARAISARLPPG